MAAVETLVYPLLTGSAELTALVGTRVYPTTPTTNTQLPYLVYQITGSDTPVGLGGTAGVTRYDLDVEAFGVNLSTCLSVLTAAYAALVGGVGGYVQGVMPGDRSTSPEEYGYHALQTFEFWAGESPVVVTPTATGTVTTGVDSVTLAACGHTLVLDCSGLTLDGTQITPGGGGGGGESTFVYSQNTPATVWTIAHDLGRYPDATIVDSGGNVVIGSVNYPDTNTVVISFTAAFGGKAFLN